MSMVEIERRGRDWIVIHGDEAVSLHPAREEAERVAAWLTGRADAAEVANSSTRNTVTLR